MKHERLTKTDKIVMWVIGTAWVLECLGIAAH